MDEARRRWHQQHQASWLQLAATLRSEGWEAQVTCGADPVQVDIPEWEDSESHPEAGYLPAAVGEAIIRRLTRRYQEER